MLLISEVLECIDNAIPIFSDGERRIDELLERFSFDSDGITQQWEMFDSLSKDIMEFLRDRFPTLGKLNHSICCDLQMCQLREKIERNEREYEYYRSIMAHYAL